LEFADEFLELSSNRDKNSSNSAVTLGESPKSIYNEINRFVRAFAVI
jgi:hypothetical protein